jgi:hypothetical protein
MKMDDRFSCDILDPSGFLSVQLTIIKHNITATKYLIVYNLDLQDTAIQIYSLGISESLRLRSATHYVTSRRERLRRVY